MKGVGKIISTTGLVILATIFVGGFIWLMRIKPMTREEQLIGIIFLVGLILYGVSSYFYGRKNNSNE